MSQLDSVTRVVQLVNDARKSSGLAPLHISSELSQAAQKYSDAMAQTGCYAHDCPPVPSLKDRVEQAGYHGWSALGENIYLSPATPDKAVEGWLASPEHRKNILTGEFTDTGAGLARDAKGQPYWTQDFGSLR